MTLRPVPDDPEPRRPPTRSTTPQNLTAVTVHGLKWSYASTVVTVVFQIGVTAVLARILTPAAFGLVAMAAVFLGFGQYFAQMGAGQAVVQRPELSRDDVKTAFTTSVLIGLAFCGLFIALAPFTEALFPDTPDVVQVTRVMAITFIIGGFTATTQGLLRRRFAFRAIALTEIGSYLLGYATVGLTLALLDFGAWSLVAASLAQGALAAAAYTTLCRRDVGVGLKATSFKNIYAYGSRVSIIGFAEFIGYNLDKLWTGHFLGSQAMGLYTRAVNIAGMPLYYLTTSLSRVLLPGYSRIQSERARLKSVYLATITVIAAIIIPISWGVAGAAEEVILTLLGPRWVTAAPVLTVLALGVPLTLLSHFGAILCEATATLNAKIAISAGRIAWIAVLLVALDGYGVVGIAVAYVLAELIVHLCYLFVMRRLLSTLKSELGRAYSLGLVSGTVTGIALYGLHAGLTPAGWPAPLILTAQVSIGALFLLFTITRARHGAVWREVRARLTEAGYSRDGRGSASRVFRSLDRLAQTPANKEPERR